jgi:hypothetical protein
MSGDTRQLKIVVDGDPKGGRAALKSVNDGLGDVAKTQEQTSQGWERFRTGLLAVTAVAGAGLLKLGASSVKAASDLNETQSQIGRRYQSVR